MLLFGCAAILVPVYLWETVHYHVMYKARERTYSVNYLLLLHHLLLLCLPLLPLFPSEN
jgi:hypothetical protein